MSSDNEKTSFPLDKLPSDWNDLNKLDNFYSPLRNKQVNPLDWGSKLEFWKTSIEIYCSHNKLYSFSFSHLQKCFLHMGRIPSCLRDIFEELLRQEDIISLDNFLHKSRPDPTLLSWAANTVIKRPLSWMFNKVKTSIVPLDVTNVDYIHLKVVGQKALELANAIPLDFREKVVELKEFAKITEREGDIENLKLLLHYLEINGKVAIREIPQDRDRKLILLRFISDGLAPEILDIDVDIYLLTMKEDCLQKDIERLEICVEKLHLQAKEHLKNKHKQLALILLRKKKLLEKSIENRAMVSLNVSSLLHNLQDATHNKEVISTYKNAINNFKSAGLNLDNVDEIMANLGEQIDINNDIQAQLAQSFEASDETLEAELAELLIDKDDSPTDNNSPKANVCNITHKLDVLKLPNVPESPEKVLSNAVVF